jgi:VanZ family protein
MPLPEAKQVDRGTFGRWAPAAFWAVAILAVSSIPGHQVARVVDLSYGLDKVCHFGEYLVLGVLLARSLGARVTLRFLLVAWLGLAVFATLDELHQALIPGRIPDVLDWTADTSGGALGMLAGWAWSRMRSRGADLVKH